MDRTAFYQSLTDFVLRRKRPDRALIVGIDGVDGSGKTTLAATLGRFLEQAGHPVCRLSVDDFHHPRRHRYRRGAQSPEGYYRDSIDHDAFANQALRPIFDAQAYPVRCQTKLLDLAQDKLDIRFQEIGATTILLAEGVFLFRPEIFPLLHVKIFIRADFAVIMGRVKIRDRDILGSARDIQERYERKYIPGQQLYLDDVAPEGLADLVVDNNDFESPRIVSPPLQPSG